MERFKDQPADSEIRRQPLCRLPRRGHTLLCLLAIFGFASQIGAAWQNLDPPGACVSEDSNWATLDGGCKDLQSGGLVWSASAYAQTGQLTTYVTAQDYCSASTEGGYTDWRVPTLAELQMAQQHGAFTHINLLANGGIFDSVKWSTDRDNSKKYAYLLRFSDGFVLKTLIKVKLIGGGTGWSTHDTMCVRSAQ